MESLRDMSVPYTDEEIAKVLSKLRTLKTYDHVTDSIGNEDFDEVSIALGETRTPQQIQHYKNYFIKQHGGRFDLKHFEATMRTFHSISLFATQFAKMADTNGDGVISQEEFEDIYELMAAQYTGLDGKTYADFLREADTNQDGKVDIAEMRAWIEKSVKNAKY